MKTGKRGKLVMYYAPHPSSNNIKIIRHKLQEILMTKLNCYHWDFHGRKMSLLSVAQLGEGGENPSSPPSLDSIMIMIVDHLLLNFANYEKKKICGAIRASVFLIEFLTIFSF